MDFLGVESPSGWLLDRAWCIWALRLACCAAHLLGGGTIIWILLRCVQVHEGISSQPSVWWAFRGIGTTTWLVIEPSQAYKGILDWLILYGRLTVGQGP